MRPVEERATTSAWGCLRLGPWGLSSRHRLPLRQAKGVAAESVPGRSAGPDLYPRQERSPVARRTDVPGGHMTPGAILEHDRIVATFETHDRAWWAHENARAA